MATPPRDPKPPATLTFWPMGEGGGGGRGMKIADIMQRFLIRWQSERKQMEAKPSACQGARNAQKSRGMQWLDERRDTLGKKIMKISQGTCNLKGD